MNKPVSLALLAVGVVLLIYGFSASDSASASFSRMFSGAPTDKTTWLTIGGVAAVVAGLGGLLLHGSRR